MIPTNSDQGAATSACAPVIIVALDMADPVQALQLVECLDPRVCRVKVGKQLFVSAGPAIVEKMVDRGYSVFLDLKFHDIPNTVAGACTAAAQLGVWMINVHALGGARMLGAARNALDKMASPPLLIAVTLLTSMDGPDLRQLGISEDPRQCVLRWGRLAIDNGLDGLVCSAHEAPMLRQELGSRPCLVTPGIRPAGSAIDDQRRVVAPLEAIRLGADYLVVGRPVTSAADPHGQILALQSEISHGLR